MQVKGIAGPGRVGCRWCDWNRHVVSFEGLETGPYLKKRRQFNLGAGYVD
jgi:hypothetical protein